MSGYEPEKLPDPKPAPQARTRGQAADLMTVSGTFGGTTASGSVTLDMGGIDDLGGTDEVTIYSATGETPNGQRQGTDSCRADDTPAPAHFPTGLAGGTWTANHNFWVQVNSRTGAIWTRWQGSINATSGTHDIPLDKQT